jgi:hypothetical protein
MGGAAAGLRQAGDVRKYGEAFVESQHSLHAVGLHDRKMQAVPCRQRRLQRGDLPGGIDIVSSDWEHGNDQVVEQPEGIVDCRAALVT